MNMRHIKIFLAVCENDCNITKAAKQLYLAQPAVSAAIHELENYYGILLFDRISKRLYITDAGRQFLEYARRICALFNDLENQMHHWEELGIMRVGASVTIGSQFLPDYIKTFLAFYPGMDVRVQIAPSIQLEQKILANGLDFALIEGSVHEPGLVAEDYMDDSLIIIGPGTSPGRRIIEMDLETFKKQRFLLREMGSGTREEIDAVINATGFSVDPVWEATSTTALVNGVMHGFGVTVLPCRMVMGAIDKGLVTPIRVKGLKFERKFRIIYHKDKYLSPAMQSFIQLCKNYEYDYPMPQYTGLF